MDTLYDTQAHQLAALLADWHEAQWELDYQPKLVQFPHLNRASYDESEYYRKHLKEGRKYINLDVGSSGAFMMDKVTEDIFCIKAYGVPHKRKLLGKLGEVTGKDLVRKRFWYLR